MVRLITGARTVSDEDAIQWIEELTAFSRRPAEERLDALDRAWRAMLPLAEVGDAPDRVYVRYARVALRASPECSRAYLYLAGHVTTSLEHRYDLYHMALRAAQRSTSREMLTSMMGNYEDSDWTRDCLQALEGMANTLWEMGDHEGGARHYEELLRLSVVDRAGARYALLFYGLAVDDVYLTERVMARYPGDTATEWLYNVALYRFRTESDSSAARRAVKQALAANATVAEFMLGRQPLPEQFWYEQWAHGSREEAIVYCVDQAFLWDDTPGALDWLTKRAGLLARAKAPKSGEPPPGRLPQS